MATYNIWGRKKTNAFGKEGTFSCNWETTNIKYLIGVGDLLDKRFRTLFDKDKLHTRDFFYR